MVESIRLRADPEMVRVGVRYHGENKVWVVTIRNRATGQSVLARGLRVEEAIESAIEKATEAKVPGMDPDCSWAYDHPQVNQQRQE